MRLSPAFQHGFCDIKRPRIRPADSLRLPPALEHERRNGHRRSRIGSAENDRGGSGLSGRPSLILPGASAMAPMSRRTGFFAAGTLAKPHPFLHTPAGIGELMVFSFDLLVNAVLAGVLLGGFYAAVTAGVSLSFGILDIV